MIVQADQSFFSVDILHSNGAKIVGLSDAKVSSIQVSCQGKMSEWRTSLVAEATELKTVMAVRAEVKKCIVNSVIWILTEEAMNGEAAVSTPTYIVTQLRNDGFFFSYAGAVE